MFAAIETAAQIWTALVDRASVIAKVDTRLCLGRRKNVNRLAVAARPRELPLIRLDIVAKLGMQHQPLTAPAAFDAAIAGNLSLFAQNAGALPASIP